MPKQVPLSLGPRRNQPYRSTSSRKPFPQGAQPEVRSLVVQKAYCSFCGHFAGGNCRECTACGAYICIQPSPEVEHGCIFYGTVPASARFLCPPCDVKRWRREQQGKEDVLSYGYRGYATRTRSKLDWPMVLVTASLRTAPAQFVRDSLSLEFLERFARAPENLCSAYVELTTNVSTATVKKQMKKCVEHIWLSIDSKVPANIFFVLDTHSDCTTGHLQYAGGATAPVFSEVCSLLKSFCGSAFFDAMHAVAQSAVAKGQHPRVENENPARMPDNPWYNASPSFRGGWRGLLLSSCGPAVTHRDGFTSLMKLLQEGLFDFVLAFGGSSTIGHQVRNTLVEAIERVAIDKTGDLWDMLSRAVCQDLHLLQTNSVVILFRERHGRDSMPTAREISLHYPPSRPWGVSFSACGKEGCKPEAYDFNIKSDKSGVRMNCKLCGWKSPKVCQKDASEYVTLLDSAFPNVFWHSYPLSARLAALFVTAAGRKDSDGPKEQDTAAVAPGKKQGIRTEHFAVN